MAQSFDGIPYGLLHVDGRGNVLDHEDVRCGPLIGRDLFTAILPTRQAGHLAGLYRDFLAGGAAALELDLTLTRETGDAQIRLSFGRVCADIAIVRIRPIDGGGGRLRASGPPPRRPKDGHLYRSVGGAEVAPIPEADEYRLFRSEYLAGGPHFVVESVLSGLRHVRGRQRLRSPV
jgi:hypothetical protein